MALAAFEHELLSSKVKSQSELCWVKFLDLDCPDVCVVMTTFALNTILSFRIAKGVHSTVEHKRPLYRGQISDSHDGVGWNGTL